MPSPSGEGCRGLERAFPSSAWLCGRHGRGLVWHSAERAMSLPAGSSARLRVLSAAEPSHPTDIVGSDGGFVSLFVPETGRSDGSLLLGDCFLQP